MGREYEDLEIQNSGNGGKGDVDAASNVRDTASDAPAKAYGRGANGGSGGDGGNGGDIKFEVPQGRTSNK